MFDLQILTPTDLTNANFSSSEYVLKKGELFGIPTRVDMPGGANKLYIGNGDTPIKNLRYIGQDIDGGNITNSAIYNSFLRNVTIDDATINGNRLGGYFDCTNATLTGGTLMSFKFEECNIPANKTMTNNGTITGGTLSGNAFISGNTNTDITGGKIAGSTILFSKSVNDGEFTDVGYIGNQGDPGQEKFFSSTGYPAQTYFGGYKLRCLDIKGYTMIDETGKFNTRSALVDGKLGYTDDAYHTVIQNTDLSIGNKFPSYINTNVTSANYLNLTSSASVYTYTTNAKLGKWNFSPTNFMKPNTLYFIYVEFNISNRYYRFTDVFMSPNDVSNASNYIYTSAVRKYKFFTSSYSFTMNMYYYIAGDFTTQYAGSVRTIAFISEYKNDDGSDATVDASCDCAITIYKLS